MTSTRPTVATTSPSEVPRRRGGGSRRETASRSNIRLASTAPTIPPTTWAATEQRGLRGADLPQGALDQR